MAVHDGLGLAIDLGTSAVKVIVFVGCLAPVPLGSIDGKVEELLPGPDMIGDAHGHRRGATNESASVVRLRHGDVERDVGTEPVT
jgi:hypothetical protein